ncbi:hypothetical protein LCGC14_3147140, partial [marine sediment metagenome]
QEAGRLLPDRRIGLSAHDFQQAVAAPEVILTRATRDAEAETVVSRWLNRLMNLLGGLPDQGGTEALAAMRRRGAAWLGLAAASDADVVITPPARRPAPRPPVEMRPSQLSVTEIQKLIRDPYSVYAGRILKLRRLDPLRQEPDAPLRGTILHDIFETFIGLGLPPDDPNARSRLMEVADAVLGRQVPWPTARRMWRARIDRVADWFIAGELVRQAEARPLKLEGKGRYLLPGTGFTLTGKADRIDQRSDGRLLIYDYKTGAPPTPEWAADGSMEYMAPGTSIFDPVLCEIAYRWFSPPDGRVLDPFAGGSVRGIVAAYLGRDYTGIDLSLPQVEANR